MNRAPGRSVSQRHARVRCFLACVLLVFAPLFLTGCWDAMPIDHRALVNVIGVDMDDAGGFEVTALIPTRQTHGLTGGQNGGAPRGQQGSGLTQVTGRGRTIGGALADLARESDKVIDLSLLTFLLVGRATSVADLRTILIAVQAHPRIPMSCMVLMAPGRAAEAIWPGSRGENQIDQWLAGLARASHGPLGETRIRTAWEVSSTLESRLGDISLPVIGLTEQGYRPEGMMVFDKDRGIELLNVWQSVLLNYVAARQYSGGSLAVSVRGEIYPADLAGSRTRVKVRGSARQPEISIEMDLKVRIETVEPRGISLGNRSLAAEVSEAISERVSRDLEELIDLLQTLGSDAMGIYRAYRLRHPEVSLDEFRTIYQHSEIKATVTVNIMRTGLLR